MAIDKSKTKFGYKKSIEDPRDYGVSRLLAPVNVFPDEFTLDISKLQVQDQGDLSCCVAEAACYHLAFNNNNLFSVGFVYGNRATTDYQGEGMMPSQMLAHLKSEGAVLKTDFPELVEMSQIETDVLKAKPSLLTKAAPYKISAYAKLNNADDIKNALMQLKTPVLIAIDVYDNFFDPDSTGYVCAPSQADLQDGSYGGHALTVYGWNTKGFKILNSWGTTNWGINGTCVLDYNYPIGEAWAITDKVTPQPPQPTPVVKWWRVQIGAYKELANATKQQQLLLKDGLKDTLLTNVNGLYKIQIGAFASKDNAEKLSAGLTAAKIDNFVIYY